MNRKEKTGKELGKLLGLTRDDGWQDKRLDEHHANMRGNTDVLSQLTVNVLKKRCPMLLSLSAADEMFGKEVTILIATFLDFGYLFGAQAGEDHPIPECL